MADDDFEANPFALSRAPLSTNPMETLTRTQKEKKKLMRATKIQQRGALRDPHPRQMVLQIEAEEDGADNLFETLGQTRKDALAQQLDQLAISTRDRRVEQEQLSDFISKKRQLFLIKYSLDVKREEIHKLELQAKEEEKKIEEAERWLEADATQFDQFLRENDRKAVAAIKDAEQASQRRQEKSSEIKKLQAEVMAVSSEVTKQGDKILELRAFRDFLETLSPPEFQQQCQVQRESARQRATRDDPTSFRRRMSQLHAPSAGDTRAIRKSAIPPTASSQRTRRRGTSAQTVSGDGETDHIEDDVDLAVEPPLHFKTPMELIRLLEELEQSNLSLIQNGQETEEALQDLSDRLAKDREVLQRNRDAIEVQVQEVTDQLARDHAETASLQEKCKFFVSAGADDQDEELAAFDAKVTEVYRACIGENEAGISTLQMLTNIENKLEELFEKMSKIPPDELARAEKAKDKERRLRLREEKLAAQKRHQEERVRRALQRANEGPKKQVGKKLVYRSAPPPKHKKKTTFKAQTAEEEEMKYLFS
eukprot:m.45686 g.45686  ORF g.45686 m.45686 type:complete len:538 (-) comp10893_c0_seq3:221-1834(-)